MRDELRFNERLFAVFDEGALCQAILGSGVHFVPGVTRREEHDRLLVLSQMALWAHDRDCAPLVARAVEQAILSAAERDDIGAAFDIAWTFLLIADDEGRGIDLDWRTLSNSLCALIDRAGGRLAEDPELATLVSSVEARVPGGIGRRVT